MKPICLIICLGMLLSSCFKETTSLVVTRIQNNSGHKVAILPYKSGLIVPSDTFTIANMSEKVVRKSGLATPPTYALELNWLSDSIVVVFDEIYKISHYPLQAQGNSPEAYYATHPRNVLNDKNYQFNKTEISKRVTQFEHIYTFTEQDYLDAK